MLKLHVVIASTRPGRARSSVADWFLDIARADQRFETLAVDLDEVDLPAPRRAGTTPGSRSTKTSTPSAGPRSSTRPTRSMFVTPEYNYSSAPVTAQRARLRLSRVEVQAGRARELRRVASGGLRAVQMTKLPVSALGMMPLPEGVSIPFFFAAPR